MVTKATKTKADFKTDAEYRDHLFVSNIGLLHKFAKGGYARLLDAGVPTDYEDVFQEMALWAVKASEKYDPESGFTFGAYMGRCVINGFHNRFAQKAVTEQIELGLLRIGDLSFDTDGEDFDAMEYISVQAGLEEESLEDLLIKKQQAKLNIAVLSPRLRVIVANLISPYKAVVEAHEQELAEYLDAKANGQRCGRVPSEINLRYLAKHFGMKYSAVQAEVKEKLGITL